MQARAHPLSVLSHALLRDLSVELAVAVLETYLSHPPNALGAAIGADKSKGRHTGRSTDLSDTIASIVELLTPSSSDLLVVQTARLASYIITYFHDHSVGVRPAVWSVLSSRCISVCKAHLLSSKSSSHFSVSGSGDGEGASNPWSAAAGRRPFFWAARGSVLEVLQLLMRHPQCQSWTVPFLSASGSSSEATSAGAGEASSPVEPEPGDTKKTGGGAGVSAGREKDAIPNHLGSSSGAGGQPSSSSSSSSSSQKHLVLLRLILDARTRAVACDALYALLHQCAQAVFLDCVASADTSEGACRARGRGPAGAATRPIAAPTPSHRPFRPPFPLSPFQDLHLRPRL